MSDYETDECTGEVRYRGRWYSSFEAIEEERMTAAEARWEMERDERLLEER